jgi:hypothetical protein
MSQDNGALASALACLDAYLDGLNRGDEAATNAACHFPHVRLAGGKVAVWEKSSDYKLADFRSRPATAGIAAPGTSARPSMLARTRSV